MIMAKTLFTVKFYYLPLSHYTLKTSNSNKPILDFAPGRKAMLGSTDATGTIATPLLFGLIITLNVDAMPLELGSLFTIDSGDFLNVMCRYPVSDHPQVFVFLWPIEMDNVLQQSFTRES